MIIPFEIKRIKDPSGEIDFRVVVNIEDAIKNLNMKNELKEIEKEYAHFVGNGKKIIEKIQRSGDNKTDARFHWALGDLIAQFLGEIRSRGFFFANLKPTLSRDLGLSQRYIGYHMQLREEYPNVDLIHAEIGWSNYQELLDIRSISKREICIKKILEGEIKTRDELRKLKKSLNMHNPMPRHLTNMDTMHQTQ